MSTNICKIEKVVAELDVLARKDIINDLVKVPVEDKERSLKTILRNDTVLLAIKNMKEVLNSLYVERINHITWEYGNKY